MCFYDYGIGDEWDLDDEEFYSRKEARHCMSTYEGESSTPAEDRPKPKKKKENVVCQ